MYAQYQPGAVTLTADDVNGICSIYQPTPTHGCSCTSAPARSGAWALATAFSLAALLGARRRRRASR
jgi:MYXO-CTERM domain-containing protein